jgi:hypothetical protein
MLTAKFEKRYWEKDKNEFWQIGFKVSLDGKLVSKLALTFYETNA